MQQIYVQKQRYNGIPEENACIVSIGKVISSVLNFEICFILTFKTKI